MNFSFQRLDKVRALIMVLSFALMLLSAAGAAVGVRAAAASRAAIDSVGNIDASMPKIVITNTPLQRADYQALADRIRVLYPDLSANGTDSSIVIRGSTPQSYRSWRLALADTMPHGERSQWRLKDFCAGNCAGSYFSAEVAVNRISVDVVKSEN